MAKQNAKSAANDIQNLFGPQGYQSVFKTWASMNERMASIAIHAGTRANDIASETTKEALSNMRDLTKVRDAVSEYGNAYKDFVKKQAELFTRAAQNYSNETQRVGTKAAELASKSGEEISDKVTTAAEGVAQTVHSVTQKAA
ncbi:phasin protein [Primorskyibacter sedentarius]|uniref:Phasin protein n=1 Tax=Primorskyibacter sedentarius TaxID=745311 RepID=A0A4V2UMU8_9RHOB|nr:phasin family protein [Primorskyibacter sedentarius]TCS59037.1 phasin protein [Primorskyibacter sedentarius]